MTKNQAPVAAVSLAVILASASPAFAADAAAVPLTLDLSPALAAAAAPQVAQTSALGSALAAPVFQAVPAAALAKVGAQTAPAVRLAQDASVPAEAASAAVGAIFGESAPRRGSSIDVPLAAGPSLARGAGLRARLSGLRASAAAVVPAMAVSAPAAIRPGTEILAAVGGFLGFLLGSVPFHKGEDYGWSFDLQGAVIGGLAGAALAGGVGAMASGAVIPGAVAAGVGGLLVVARWATTRGPRAPEAAIGRLADGVNRFPGADYKAQFKAAKKAYRNASFGNGDGRFMSRGRDNDYGSGGPSAGDVDNLRAGLEDANGETFDTLVLLVRELPGAQGEPGIIVVRGARQLHAASAGREGLTLPGVEGVVPYKSVEASVGYAWR